MPVDVVAGPVQLLVLLVAEVDAVEPVGGGERLPPGHKHLWHLQWLLVWWYDDGASSPPPSCFPLTGATLFTTLSSTAGLHSGNLFVPIMHYNVANMETVRY